MTVGLNCLNYRCQEVAVRVASSQLLFLANSYSWQLLLPKSKGAKVNSSFSFVHLTRSTVWERRKNILYILKMAISWFRSWTFRELLTVMGSVAHVVSCSWKKTHERFQGNQHSITPFLDMTTSAFYHMNMVNFAFSFSTEATLVLILTILEIAAVYSAFCAREERSSSTNLLCERNEPQIEEKQTNSEWFIEALFCVWPGFNRAF